MSALFDTDAEDEEIEVECFECGNAYVVTARLLMAEDYILVKSDGTRMILPQDVDFDDEHCPVCSEV